MNVINALTVTICVFYLIGSIQGQCVFYTIRNGDTFFALAQANGITVNDMISANPGVDFNRLQIGQVVCIPTGPPGPLPTLPPIPGQTKPTLPTLPPIPIFTTQPPTFFPTQPPTVFTTQPIIFPTQPLNCDFKYVVKQGETCSLIASTFPQFNRLNGGLNCNALRIGQQVCIGNSNGFTFNQCSFTYTVRQNDDCESIGQRTGSTLEYLYNCNPGINLPCNNILPNQKLRI